ncbi:MAG: hypothetical protein IPI67_29115 [Myxococcales bacterium]|nr:hypothetical protein [Myxococcales bacterium]
MPAPSPLRLRVWFVVGALAATGCLKSLDEARIDEKKDGSAGGGVAGGGAGGASGSGGTSATGGSGGTGATGGSGGAGGSAGTVPYDPTKFPVTKLWAGTAPIVFGVDETDVFHSVAGVASSALTRTPVAGGTPETLPPTLEKPGAIAVPSTSTFLFAVGGRNSGAGGSLVRTTKAGGVKDEITIPSASLLAARGLYVATDGFAYVTFDTDATHSVGVARFGLASGVQTGTAIFTGTGSETGGAVVASGSCVYFVASGGIWVMPTGGGSRKSALSNAVTDAIGLAADAANFYFTRGDGSVWARTLSGTTCDGTGSAEKQLASGFVNIGPIIRFKSAPLVAWTARGDDAQGFEGGGVFIVSPGGGAVTQIGPKESGPESLADGPYDVVFSTSTGELRKVPKP